MKKQKFFPKILPTNQFILWLLKIKCFSDSEKLAILKKYSIFMLSQPSRSMFLFEDKDGSIVVPTKKEKRRLLFKGTVWFDMFLKDTGVLIYNENLINPSQYATIEKLAEEIDLIPSETLFNKLGLKINRNGKSE